MIEITFYSGKYLKSEYLIQSDFNTLILRHHKMPLLHFYNLKKQNTIAHFQDVYKFWF